MDQAQCCLGRSQPNVSSTSGFGEAQYATGGDPEAIVVQVRAKAVLPGPRAPVSTIYHDWAGLAMIALAASLVLPLAVRQRTYTHHR